MVGIARKSWLWVISLLLLNLRWLALEWVAVLSVRGVESTDLPPDDYERRVQPYAWQTGEAWVGQTGDTTGDSPPFWTMMLPDAP